MRRTLLQSLLPAAVAIMMSLGIVMTAAAETDPASPSPLAPGAMALDRLVELGVLPAETRDALMRVRLEHSESVAPGALCRLAAAEQPPAPLVERCRTWLSAEGEPPAARFAVCRCIVDAEWVDADLLERCRGILAGAADHSSDARPQDAGSERAGQVIRPIRDLRLTAR